MTSSHDLSTLSRETDWQNRRVTVMGLGSFGGGVAVVRFLAERGAKVIVSDRADETRLAESLNQLRDLPRVEYCLGGHDWSHFENADLVVINPAIPPTDSFFRRLVTAATPMTTEIGLFWQLNPARVIGVTGSNGKSTTTALTHHLLAASLKTGRAWLGGNIGGSLLPHIDEILADDWIVLELSSFQLRMLNRIRARPNVSVITNFAPNHLDWHGTIEDYRRSKQALVRWQTKQDYCVLPADWEFAEWPGTARRIFTTGEMDEKLNSDTAINYDGTVSDLILPPMQLRGPHNRKNATTAYCAVRAVMSILLIREAKAGLSFDVRKYSLDTRALSTFQPLPHRLAAVASASGRTFFDDSIATTPESAIAALDSFDEPIILLAGGSDKQLDLSELAAKIATKVKAVVLLGETGPRLGELISARQSSVRQFPAASLQEAFDQAVEQSSPGDVILLSPGCASLDWFRNFQDRGDQFAELAAAWAHRTGDTESP